MRQSKKKTKQKQKCYWYTQFKKVFRFIKEESKLFSLGKITFTKPARLRRLIKNYSHIAKQKQTKTISSKTCEKCALFRINGKHENMVLDKEILTIQGKTIKLKQNLNC